ncbi:MAG TPA: hypoxanthine phosphoribosyltransferase [Acidimicrobiales bacterium]|nr:hypoxanthine phosphoribosyltransferase [Acidimicrobiales bacterium]
MTDVLISTDELKTGVARLAAELSATYGDGVVLAAVLKGSLLFLADLVRGMTISPEVDFLAISSYQPNTGRVRILKDLEVDIHDRDVVLIEDIVDTGLTSGYLLQELGQRGPRSLAICTLLDKAARRLLPVPLNFVGFEIPDAFVLGYGLDFAGRYRNLDAVFEGNLDALREDPDAHVSALYDR